MVLRRLVSSLLLASFAPLALGLGGCGGSTGTNAASQVLKQPELPTDNEAKCSVRKSQTEPLIVEWPNAARGRLEATMKKGLVAIKYEGCELTQLTACTVKTSVGPYNYTPITKKQSKVAIKDADDLYATMPVGAVKLEGKLKSAGELDVAMTIVGRYEAQTHTVFRNDLEGSDCDQATHVIAALTVGSFTFSAGADAEVGGGASLGPAAAGGKSTAKRETLQSDGDENACSKAGATDKGPPEGCGALIQIEVMSLTQGSRPAPPPPPVVVAPPVPAPTPDVPPPTAPTTPPKKQPKCKAGFHAEDGKCTRNPKKKPPPPPVSGAVASAVPTCTGTQRLVNNQCVDDTPAPAPEPPPNLAPAAPTCAENERYDGTMCVAMTPHPRTDDAKTPSIYDTPKVEDQMQPNPLKTVFMYSAIGFGILAIGAGSVAYSAASDSAGGCGPAATGHNTCTQDAIDKRSTAITTAIISDIGLGLAVASAVAWFLVPSKIKVGVGPTNHGVAATTGWSFW